MNLTLKMVTTLSLLLGWGAFVNAQTDYKKQVDDIAIVASELMGFNGTVLIANSDGVIYQRSFGFADKGKLIDLTPDYRFSPGSVTKEFTTVALMMLKKQGKINYDDNVSKYLSNLPAWSSTITIEQILTHTSGLGEIKYSRNITTADVIKQINAVEKLKYKPGEGYSYGNLNVVLRALIIEKITGKSFKTFIKESLFVPAGMMSTFGRDNLASTDPLIAFGAIPLAINGVTAYTTALDLYKWEKALWNNVLVSKDTLTKVILKPGLSGSSNRAYFDFGFFNKNKNGDLVEIWHDGTYPQHYTFKSVDFDKDLFIVLLSSDGRKSTLSELRDYISNISDNQTLKIPAVWWLTNEIKSNGFAAAIKTYKGLVERGDFVANESSLNSFGYDLNSNDQPDGALAIMKLNVELHSQSEYAYDSYAELLIDAKKYTEAQPIVERGIALAQNSDNQFILGRLEEFLKEIRKIDSK